MKHLRFLLMCLLMMVGIGSTNAMIYCDTIRLTGVEGMDELWVSGETGYCEEGFDYQTSRGIPIGVNEWIPQTGQIRVNKTLGQFGANFNVYCPSDFPHSIVMIKVVMTEGSLKPEDFELSTTAAGSYISKTDQVGSVGKGFIYWRFPLAEKVRRFRMEVQVNEERPLEKVVVPYILIYCSDGKKDSGSHGSAESVTDQDPSIDPVKPIDPELPSDSVGFGDPVDPSSQEKLPNEKTGWLPRLNLTGGVMPQNPEDPQQPQQPQKPKDRTKPEPPGTIDVKIKKHLLEPLTEEEFAMIKAKRLPFGKECLDATRNWVSHIPDIKARESAECQAELRKLTYNEYLQFMHASFESAAVDFVNIVTMTEEDYMHKEEEFLRIAKDSLLILGAEWVRLYDIKDPNKDVTLREYCKKNLPFMILVNKYQNLMGYVLF